MTTSQPAVLELKDIHVTYKARTGKLFKPDLVHAVQGVDLVIPRGHTIGIVGESGCGKSTTAKVLLGLETPTSGKILVNGKDATVRSRSQRKEFGRIVSAVFQDPSTALNPRMTVRDALRDPMDTHQFGSATQRAARVQELVGLVGLPSSALDALPGQLSGGQRQRVAIARALSLDPQVIIADEPTSALDVSVRAQILNLLEDLKESLGISMVFISHDIQTVNYISDEIVVMNAGKIVEQGPARQVMESPTHPYTQKLLGAAPSLLHPEITAA